jgi:hypothetical protein
VRLPHLLSLLLLISGSTLRAQELPAGATPRGVVHAFLSSTAGTDDSVNRAAFRGRLTGELRAADPERFRGMVPAGARFRIDTIPDIPDAPDGSRRAVAWVTVEIAKEKHDLYIFCIGDTIWRIEAINRFPTQSQRAQLISSLGEIDTSVASYRVLYGDLRRLLLSDDSLRILVRQNVRPLSSLVPSLAGGESWERFVVRDVDFAALDEYRELDDDIAERDLVFYRLDRGALETVKRTLGVRRIERDRRLPGLLFLVAGEIESGSYGYIYAPSPDLLPPLSPDGFLTLKPAAPGWWIYRRKG